MNEKELLISFLKKKRIYRRFLNNCDESIEKFCYLPTIFISGSFVFDKTKEGFSFWNKIDLQWRTLLKKKQNEVGNLH